MPHEDSTTPPPPSDQEIRERHNALLMRLGDAILGHTSTLKAARGQIAAYHKEALAQGSALLTEIKLLRQAIEHQDDDLREIRRDVTPLRVPLPPREREDSVEVGPVKVPATLLARFVRSLPVLVLGFIIALCLLALALWLSGARLQVTDPPARPVGHPHLTAPELESPRAP